MLGAHPFSVSCKGPMVTDSTQGVLLHCMPEGIAFAWVHSPAHPAGGSNNVEIVGEVLQSSEEAVIFAGNAHVPVGGAHAQARHVVGDQVKSA